MVEGGEEWLHGLLSGQWVPVEWIYDVLGLNFVPKKKTP